MRCMNHERHWGQKERPDPGPSARPRSLSEVVYRDTVCRPTKDRQRALEELCREATAIIVVGGANSNNTRELVESAKMRGCMAWRLETPAEIDPAWLHGHEVVGVTAGTSTLPMAVEAVVRRLRALAMERRPAAHNAACF